MPTVEDLHQLAKVYANYDLVLLTKYQIVGHDRQVLPADSAL